MVYFLVGLNESCCFVDLVSSMSLLFPKLCVNGCFDRFCVQYRVHDADGSLGRHTARMAQWNT